MKQACVNSDFGVKPPFQALEAINGEILLDSKRLVMLKVRKF